MSNKMLQIALLTAALGIDMDSLLPRERMAKPMDKYDEEAILKNKIKQANKAAKRLKNRGS